MDKAFAQRLRIACDSHPHAPPYGRGRQTWIKSQVRVSHEAVRKWFMGESRPKPAKMHELAALLDVDEAWLSLGIKPELEPAEKQTRSAVSEGVVNVFMGYFQINGGHVAFPDQKDPRSAFVDFYAILRGVQTPFHVSTGQKVGPEAYRITVPREFDQCTVIGAIPTGPMSVQFFRMPFAALNAHKVRRGGYYEVTVDKRDGGYLTGSDTWPRVHDFNNIG